MIIVHTYYLICHIPGCLQTLGPNRTAPGWNGHSFAVRVSLQKSHRFKYEKSISAVRRRDHHTRENQAEVIG